MTRSRPSNSGISHGPAISRTKFDVTVTDLSRLSRRSTPRSQATPRGLCKCWHWEGLWQTRNAWNWEWDRKRVRPWDRQPSRIASSHISANPGYFRDGARRSARLVLVLTVGLCEPIDAAFDIDGHFPMTWKTRYCVSFLGRSEGINVELHRFLVRRVIVKELNGERRTPSERIYFEYGDVPLKFVALLSEPSVGPSK